MLQALGMPRLSSSTTARPHAASPYSTCNRLATWQAARAALLGATPIMDWRHEFYQVNYAPNTRETFRRQTLHLKLLSGGGHSALQRPDKPARPVNSPHACWPSDAGLLEALLTYGTPAWATTLPAYLARRPTLTAQYAMARDMQRIPYR
ncbi:MAG: hypothetical protein WKG07_41820 [Hymenobacter sp.]